MDWRGLRAIRYGVHAVWPGASSCHQQLPQIQGHDGWAATHRDNSRPGHLSFFFSTSRRVHLSDCQRLL